MQPQLCVDHRAEAQHRVEAFPPIRTQQVPSYSTIPLHQQASRGIHIRPPLRVSQGVRTTQHKWAHWLEDRHPAYRPHAASPLADPTHHHSTRRHIALIHTTANHTGTESSRHSVQCWVSCALCWCILSPSTGRRPSHPSWPLSAATLLRQSL
jgi:hypothetical protein